MKPFFFLAVTASLFAQSIPLVSSGRPTAVITVAAPDEDAANELSQYIKKSTGATLPRTGAQPARILVGLAACPRATARRVRQLSRDGFLIESSPASSTLVLAGNNPDST